MAGLYFYVPRSKISDVVECGLKLSEWYDREIALPNSDGTRRVLKALLHPRDDEKLLKDPSYQCLRLEIDLDYCWVGDFGLYQMGINNSEMMERYEKTLTPISSYRFGTFRSPEALILTSVLPEHIEVMGKALDIPILYESSEFLYLNNLLEKHEETYKDTGNHLLYAFYTYLSQLGKGKMLEDDDQKLAVFTCNETSEYAVLKIPREGRFRID